MGLHVKTNGMKNLSGLLIYDDKGKLLLLHRKDHDHYETPGGKVDKTDCKDPEKPTETDFRNTAIREAFEELGQEFIFEEPEYVKGIQFVKPNGKDAIAHKFKTRILFGKPKVNEPKTFDAIRWFGKDELKKEESNLSPDLKLFLKEGLI